MQLVLARQVLSSWAGTKARLDAWWLHLSPCRRRQSGSHWSQIEKWRKKKPGLDSWLLLFTETLLSNYWHRLEWGFSPTRWARWRCVCCGLQRLYWHNEDTLDCRRRKSPYQKTPLGLMWTCLVVLTSVQLRLFQFKRETKCSRLMWNQSGCWRQSQLNKIIDINRIVNVNKLKY